MAKAAAKTNVLRLLDLAGIDYVEREYDISDGLIDARSIAVKTGLPCDQCFKTLVAVNPAKEHFVFVVPATGELDLKKAARVTDSKSIAMIPQKELLPTTGYVHGGCSPVGMKKQFPTFIEESAQLFDEIGISGGRVGLNVRIHPEKLAALIGAHFADLVKMPTGK